MRHKTCTKCGETKLVEDFHPYSRNKTIRDSQCKACINEKNKAYAATPVGGQNHSRAKRAYRLRVQYNMTPEDYTRMLQEQGGTCAICKGPPGGHAKEHYVDHCHSTGKVRGLLCMHCNSSLGHARDNVETLQRMIDYLTVKR